MKPKTIRQTVTFAGATPHDIYELLMDSKKHTAFSGGAARIGTKIGGVFSAYDGYITGKNLELVKDKKIVQQWHASDWPDDALSIATFVLTKTKTGTKLTFTQTDVPQEFYADIKQGWVDFYWVPMKEYLARG